jgi:hypothetical protein
MFFLFAVKAASKAQRMFAVMPLSFMLWGDLERQVGLGEARGAYVPISAGKQLREIQTKIGVAI